MNKTGIFSNIPMTDYHSGPGISKSDLDLINVSPYAHWHKKNKQEQEDNKSLRVGSAFHCLVLEPEKFDDEFAVAPDVDRRKKSGKQEYQDFCENSKDKIVLQQKEIDLITDMNEAIQNHDTAMMYLDKGLPEHSIYWEQDDILCKCRPDMLKENVIIDLKTSASPASIDSFSKTIYKYRYYVSAAYSTDGLKSIMNYDTAFYVFIVAETKPPYHIAVYVADPRMIEIGRDHYKKNLNQFRVCKSNNFWPGYNDDSSVEIDLPEWVYRQEENRDD